MIDVSIQKFKNRRNAVGLWNGIKIKRSSDEMAGTVGQVKLGVAGCIAFDVVTAAKNTVAGIIVRFFVDGIGLRYVFHRHAAVILVQFLQEIGRAHV